MTQIVTLLNFLSSLVSKRYFLWNSFAITISNLLYILDSETSFLITVSSFCMIDILSHLRWFNSIIYAMCGYLCKGVEQRSESIHLLLKVAIFNTVKLAQKWNGSLRLCDSLRFLCKFLIFILWLCCENTMFALLIIDFT